MASRLELHDILCEIINITESDGDRHIYFNPPASFRMKYPAIRYELSDIEVTHANNLMYKQDNKYELIVITEDPDSDIIAKVMKLPMCKFNRYYRADNLNHYTFTIYF